MRTRTTDLLLRARWPLAILVIALAALPAVLKYFVWQFDDQWQVDIEVYREAGVSLLMGRPIYSAMTQPPQLLPFTYPPFAALLAIPLALLPFHLAAWLWGLAQVAAVTATVWYAAYRLIHRTGDWAPLTLAGLTAPMLWLQPVDDGIRFGQVNAFLVLACLMDLRRPRPKLLAWLPPGVLVGFAMAVKLYPGVFVIHYLVCRRWREAAAAVTTAVATTVGVWLLLPEASFAFWGGALQDPSRLGANAGTSNQAIRGMLLRAMDEGLVLTVIWLVLAGAVGWFGFRLARRFWRDGDSIAEVATVGLMACLISPVSWIHHFHWVVVVVFALLGAEPLRRRYRLGAGIVVAVWFTCHLPWLGLSYLNNESWPALPGRILREGDLIGGLVALGLLWWTRERDGRARGETSAEGGSCEEARAGAEEPPAGADGRAAGADDPTALTASRPRPR